MTPKKHEAPEGNLTSAQVAALPLLAQGALKKDAAAMAGVTPQTVSEWLGQPHFQAALSVMREKLVAVAAERFAAIAGKALTTVEQIMEKGSEGNRLKAGMYVLDRMLRSDVRTVSEDSKMNLLRELGVNL